MNHPTYKALLLAGLLAGCQDEVSPSNPTSTNNYLISSDSISSISVQDLKGIAGLAGQTGISELIKHGVTTFKITYQTTYKAKPIEASGLIYIPQQLAGPAPLLSLQHGTTFLKDKAPSVSNSFTGMEYFAAAGYIAVMPDYIGYGDSDAIFHPYYDEDHSAVAVIDMLRSAKEFLEKKKISSNDQLFLAGYSEGGYVTLAAAKEIEENFSSEFPLTAIAAGAGGYDLTQMLDSVATGSYYSYPAYLAFVLKAYNITNDWNKPMSYYFNDKYATAIDNYLNGQYDGWQLNNRLTTNVAALLNPTFLAGIKDPNGEMELKNALKENSVSGWKTSLPIKLFHGTNDEIIPYQNSELTLANFKDAGSANVDLTLIQGGSHGSSFIPMLQQVVPWFETLKK